MMYEVNIDTLVGPTHMYGGLSLGNIASVTNKLQRSHPKKAALEGLKKMQLLSEFGLTQLILPPQPRPVMPFLRELGFPKNEQKALEMAYHENPVLLFQCSSSSSMWTANAATVCSSRDSKDKKVHISIANLASNVHRSLEASSTYRIFTQVFPHFTIHPPLPSTFEYFDEGAANHTRFDDGTNAVHFFVWGRSSSSSTEPQLFPARQSKVAQIAIMRRHKLDPNQVVFAQQTPSLIDKGVFHNDVIATGHKNLFLLHEEAYVNTKAVLQELQQKINLRPFVIKNSELSVDDAVSSYLFNSQIITSNSRTILICPMEVKKQPAARKVAESLYGNAVDEVRYIDINQSMKNGGGPACLRLRLPLTPAELQKIHPGVIYSPKLHKALADLIEKYYPETFCLADLLDPALRTQFNLCYKKIYAALGLDISFFTFPISK